MRHRFGTILGVAVCAVLAGATSSMAIAEWAADLPPAVRLRLGVERGRPPSESTIRRCLQRVDHDQLDRVASAWLSARATGPPGRRRVVAVDGKSARGAPHRHRPAGAPAGRVRRRLRMVLGQCTVDGKTNEINAFAPLLDRVDLTGMILTADALHTQVRHVTYLHGRDAHWILPVKANQCATRRSVVSPPQAGGIRREVPGSDGLPDAENAKGTVACQLTGGRAQALGRRSGAPQVPNRHGVELRARRLDTLDHLRSSDGEPAM